MHSSISNSNVRIPELNFKPIWFRIFLLSVIILFLLELNFRIAGVSPSVEPAAKSLWSLIRTNIDNEDITRQIVILGSSIDQAALVGEVLEEAFPEYVSSNLAIVGGGSAFSVLEDIAINSEFNGVLLCSVDPLFSMNPNAQQRYVDYYHNVFSPSFSHSIDTRITVFLQQYLVLANAPYQKPKQMMFPEPLWVHFDAKRQMRVDYSLASDEQILAHKLGRRRYYSLIRQNWPSVFEKISFMVEVIKKRGGEVIFLNLPVSPEYYAAREEEFPRTEYWDSLNRTGAVLVHFKDLSDTYDMPRDGQHLGSASAVVFTAILSEKIRPFVERNSRNHKP